MDEAARFQAAQAHLSQFETVWLFGPSVENLLSQNEAPWWDSTAAMKDVGTLAMAKHVRVGPVLHNATIKGFDADLALRLFKNADVALAKLEKEMKLQGWKALNVDLESLPESAAADYENFLKTLVARFKKSGIEISICLHAKTDPKGTYEGGRFQRWHELAKIPVSFIVMAYDYSWSESAPGPIAPASWIERAGAFALTQFKSERIVMALPVFGYHWKKDSAVSSGWKGTPEIAPVLAERTSETGWNRDTKVELTDGHAFKKDADEVITYDDSASVSAKLRRLRAKGFKRFAIWRLGGEDAALYQALEKK